MTADHRGDVGLLAPLHARRELVDELGQERLVRIGEGRRLGPAAVGGRVRFHRSALLFRVSTGMLLRRESPAAGGGRAGGASPPPRRSFPAPAPPRDWRAARSGGGG